MPPVPPTVTDGRTGSQPPPQRGATKPKQPTGALRSQQHTERKGDLVYRVKYCNTLPDIPFDPKFIAYPFDPMRFVHYKQTSLERQFKHELLTEQDMGVSIDLINPDTYKADPLNTTLDEADEKLLEEELTTPRDSKRSQQHAKNYSWLRRTEYISTEFNRFATSSDKAETKVGASIKKLFAEEELYRDKASQISAIQATFDAAKRPVEKHYSKPGVRAVEVLPLFPDFRMWKHLCTHVLFDSDPATKLRPATGAEMSQAMIRGMMDESGDQFVAYFLPTEDTLTKLARDDSAGVDYVPGDEYSYLMAREYNWTIKTKSSSGCEDNYFFILRHNDGCYYNELETKVRLSKRRKQGQQPAQTNNSVLVVKHREFTEAELNQHVEREELLDPPVLQDDDDEEEVMEEPEEFIETRDEDDVLSDLSGLNESEEEGDGGVDGKDQEVDSSEVDDVVEKEASSSSE